MSKKSRKKKEQTKRSWMVGFLIIAMIAFIASQIPWNKFSGSKQSTNNYDPTIQSNRVQTSKATTFEKEGELFISDKEGTSKATINIEVADSEEERNLGLMYRKKMDDNNGMLFVFDNDAPRNFWMKNTYLSLDFIFINSQNEIVNIKKNIAPMSEAGVPSDVPAKYVLELNAGYADGYQLQIGDIVSIDYN